MAARARSQQSVSSHNVRYGREIMRPIISTDVMGNRNVEVVPVGAWVEPAADFVQPDPLMAAQLEEEKISRMKAQKENRLRNFQKQVKQRVTQASHFKRQKQIQEAEEAFERERKVVEQSCLTGELPRRDTCSHRQDLDMAIRNRLMEKYGEDILQWEREESSALHSTTEKSHEFTGKARQQLSSKKIAGEDEETRKTVPISNGDIEYGVKRNIQKPVVKSLVEIDRQNGEIKSTKKRVSVSDCDEDTQGSDDEDEFVKSRHTENDNNNAEIDKVETGDQPEQKEAQRLHVRITEPAMKAQRKKKNRPVSAKRPSSARLKAILADNESDVLARQQRQQTAVSRRIFMDREREAVRENIRRREHKKKIASLKNQKEEYRQELEDLAQKAMEPVDPLTGETMEERRMRERMEDMMVKDMVERRKEDIRRSRELERYLDALRHSLMEKSARLGYLLPSLCACGETIWDTHPEKCANNCFFYRNHRAYARALQSLLSSSDIM